MIFAIPMRLPSVANLREHWATKAKRVKAQRGAVALALKSRRASLTELHAELARGRSLSVVMVRVSPRKLDGDNLSSAFKAVRDEVAKQLGVDDGSDQVAWACKQEKGPELVTVHIAAVAESSQTAGNGPPCDERS